MFEEDVREEFQILHDYSEELKRVLTMKTPLTVRRLPEIIEHITLCDHLPNKTGSEKNILSASVYYWEKCAEQWLKHRLGRKKDAGSQTQKTWEEMISQDDHKFLKRLYSGKETRTPSSNNNEDDGA